MYLNFQNLMCDAISINTLLLIFCLIKLYLKRLSYQLCHFAVFWILVPSYDKIHSSSCISENRGCIGLSDTDQRISVDFDDLIIDMNTVIYFCSASYKEFFSSNVVFTNFLLIICFSQIFLFKKLLYLE